MGDLVGVLVLDGGVGFLGVSVFCELIGAVLLVDELGGVFEFGGFVFIALELAF